MVGWCWNPLPGTPTCHAGTQDGHLSPSQLYTMRQTVPQGGRSYLFLGQSLLPTTNEPFPSIWWPHAFRVELKPCWMKYTLFLQESLFSLCHGPLCIFPPGDHVWKAEQLSTLKDVMIYKCSNYGLKNSSNNMVGRCICCMFMLSSSTR